jgi:hypothetical protein
MLGSAAGISKHLAKDGQGELCDVQGTQEEFMIRFISSAVLVAALAATTLLAQAPPGWRLRVDGSTNAADPDRPGQVQFMAMGGGFHAVTPQAAVFWNPANTATGAYTLKGRFTQLKPSSHNNYFGLVFGGNALDAAAQRYIYFLVGENGTFILKQRNGDEVTDIVRRTQNAAIRRLDNTGRSVNELEVRVAADKVDYVVNGTVVHSTPKAGLMTDGVYGFRVNHDLEVQVDNLARQ